MSALLAVAAVIAVSCGDDGASTSAPALSSPSTGGWSTPSTAADELVGTYGAGLTAIDPWYGFLDLGDGGVGHVWWSRGYEQPMETVFTYRVVDDQLVVTDDGEQGWRCERGQAASYGWSVEGGALDLVPIHELCAERAIALHAPGDADPTFDPAWYPLGDVPIVESLDPDDPVVIDTPIGTIEWTAVEATPPPTDPTTGYVPSLTTFDGGFATLEATTEGDVVISTSPDGRTWSQLPAPPIEPEYLSANGANLTVATGVLPPGGTTSPWPATLYETADEGRTWT